MYRYVYKDGMMIFEKWFDDDKDMLEFALSCPRFITLEWKKYDRKEDARPLETFPY